MEPLNSKQLAQRWPFLRVLTYFLVIFLPLLALMTGVTMMVHYPHAKAEREAIKNNQVESTALLAKTVARDIQEVVSDLLILSESKALRTLLEGTETAHGGTLVESFFSWSKRKRIYDQIRFIDERGMEVVRVNFEDGNPRVVPKEDLQPKSHRYYFKKAFALGPGEVYISPFDLNVEHKEIEQPLKPMIRLAAPAFDRQSRKRGVVVLNYLGATLIRNFERMSINVLGNVMLLNSDGFWLKGPRPEDEWAFMYENRGDRTFGNAFPEMWRRITGAKSGQVLTKNGLFTFTTVYPFLAAWKTRAASGKVSERDVRSPGDDELSWKIVCHVPHKLLNAGAQDVLSHHSQVLAVVALALAVVCWVLAVTHVNRRWAEEALRQSYKALQAAEEIRDGLCHMIVHDLNNPLMGVLGFANLLEMGLDKETIDKEKLLKYTQHIHDSGTEMSSLIKSILDVSKLEAGQMPVSLAPLDAIPLLKAVTEEFAAPAETAGINLTFESRTDKAMAMADQDLLPRIMQNLISNSLRYAGKGALVKCVVRSDGDSVVLGVEDNGPGISTEYRDKIFEKFFRVEAGPGKKQYGVGLGLAFCKMAAEAQEGTISVESEEGKGAKFEVKLKAAESNGERGE